jgi:hypothetical protein
MCRFFEMIRKLLPCLAMTVLAHFCSYQGAPASQMKPGIGQATTEQSQYSPAGTTGVYAAETQRGTATVSTRDQKPDCSHAEEVWEKGLQSQELPEKIRLYEEAVMSCPDTAKYHYSLAMAYYKDNRIEESIKEYQGALRLDPKLVAGQFNLATLQLSVHQYDSSMNHYQEFVRLAEGDVKYASQFEIAKKRIKEMTAGKGAWEERKRVHDKQMQEYLASLPADQVEPTVEMKRGIKELKLLSMTTAALLDYYGTKKDDQNCEVLAKSLKLLNRLAFQEKQESGSGVADLRLTAAVELMTVVFKKDLTAKGIDLNALPRYPTNRSRDAVAKDINSYEGESEPIAEDVGDILTNNEEAAIGISGEYEIISATFVGNGPSLSTEITDPDPDWYRLGTHTSEDLRCTIYPFVVKCENNQLSIEFTEEGAFLQDNITFKDVLKLQGIINGNSARVSGSISDVSADSDGSLTDVKGVLTVMANKDIKLEVTVTAVGIGPWTEVVTLRRIK